MKVIHLDEREARYILDGLEAAEKLAAAAEALTGRGFHDGGAALRLGIRRLREELDLPPVVEEVA